MKIRLFILLVLPVILSSCGLFGKKNDPYEGLSKNIQKIVPQAILDSLAAKGLVINRGDKPPQLSNAIVVSPMKLLSPYGPEDGYEKGRVINNYYYKMYDQDNVGNIKYDYYNSNYQDVGKGKGSFIAGDKDYFTIFSEDKGTTSGVDYTTLAVMSGKKTADGIVDFQYAFVIKEKSETIDYNLIPVETGRIWIDGDFLSENYENFDESIFTKKLSSLKLNNGSMSGLE